MDYTPLTVSAKIPVLYKLMSTAFIYYRLYRAGESLPYLAIFCGHILQEFNKYFIAFYITKLPLISK